MEKAVEIMGAVTEVVWVEEAKEEEKLVEKEVAVVGKEEKARVGQAITSWQYLCQFDEHLKHRRETPTKTHVHPPMTRKCLVAVTISPPTALPTATTNYLADKLHFDDIVKQL